MTQLCDNFLCGEIDFVMAFFCDEKNVMKKNGVKTKNWRKKIGIKKILGQVV